jgi:hypothetical protein
MSLYLMCLLQVGEVLLQFARLCHLRLHFGHINPRQLGLHFFFGLANSVDFKLELLHLRRMRAPLTEETAKTACVSMCYD